MPALSLIASILCEGAQQGKVRASGYNATVFLEAFYKETLWERIRLDLDKVIWMWKSVVSNQELKVKGCKEIVND